jgi:hypothetical protein
MSAGSHPAIPPRKAASPLAAVVQPILQRLRVAAGKSAFVRVVLVSLLAMVVTTAGVVAGALVVAPVVAQADALGAGTVLSSQLTTVATSTGTAARAVWDRVDRMTAEQLAALPDPLARYLLPSIAILSIIGAVLALLLPSRARAVPSTRTAPTNSTRLAPKKHRTPKAVEALAAAGASTADIAWKTGLPVDAVKLLLAISSGPRQVHPDTA